MNGPEEAPRQLLLDIDVLELWSDLKNLGPATWATCKSPTRHVIISVQCVSHERLGHTARVFVRRQWVAGGTEPQRQRVARGAARADRQEGCISCAPSDSRVIIGGAYGSTYMELFRVESGPRIASVHLIHMRENYLWFSATCGSDTLVVMSYPYSEISDNSVRVHRLRGDRLEELARTWSFPLNSCGSLMDSSWPIMTTRKSHAVIELEVSDTRLERRGPKLAVTRAAALAAVRAAALVAQYINSV